MATDEHEITIEIICTNPPGTTIGDRHPVHIAIQKDEELMDAEPADHERIVFKPTLRVREHTDGSVNFLGPYAHGPRAERFIYLVWAVMPLGQPAQRFSRIKLHLNHIRWTDVQKALTRKKPIEVTLPLTNAKGQPLVATVRANVAKWEL
jgi:hypothetical protein